MISTAWMFARDLATDTDGSNGGPGAGNSLNPAVLLSAGIATLVATIVSAFGIWLQLKNYRKPLLQRMTVRIMIMVPLYAISSLISLFSLNAAFAIDAIRDIYEAFVIYNFFSLIVAYLGGERSVLILLYGRPPRKHLFPVNLFVRELDASDPFTFLFLKRGILQYVQVKPILTAATLILKATGTYKEGELSWSAGYLYVSFVYNISICLSLYCLAMFWVCVNADIKPFRPMPKFLCVKGILFFSFWQAITISALVAAGAIKRVGPYTDSEHISLAITDTLICYEMPLFAFAHWFAFSHTDYIDKHLHYAARMPFYYAFRDAFGALDVLEDSRATLAGGVDYRTFEPVEGGMHQGIGRERRIKAGLRYSKGGRKKYWLPMPTENPDTRHTGPISALKTVVEERSQARHGYAPVMDTQGDVVFHDETQSGDDLIGEEDDPVDELEYHDPDNDEWTKDLTFDDPDPEIERLFADSRRLLFGDYHYPTIDVSSEDARRRMWDEEEQILKDQRAAFSPVAPSGGTRPPYHPSPNSIAGTTASGVAVDSQRQRLLNGVLGYGATGSTSAAASRSQSDPDARAARSAVERHLKGKASLTSGSGRKGVYGGWAEQASSSSAASSPSSSRGHSTSNTPIAEHPPSIPVIDYTPYETVTSDTDPSKGAIDLRYARTTTRPPVAPSPRASNSALRPNGLGLDVGGRAPSPLSRSRGGSVTSVPPSPTVSKTGEGSNASSRSSPTITHVRPEVDSGSSSPWRTRSSSNLGNYSPKDKNKDKGGDDLPSDAIDLVVEDMQAEEDEMTRERRKGEPAVRQTGERRIYRREYLVRVPDPNAHGVAGEGGSASGEGEVIRDVQVEVDEEPGVPQRVSDAQAPSSLPPAAKRRSQGQPVIQQEKVTVRDEQGRETDHWSVDTSTKLDDEDKGSAVPEPSSLSSAGVLEVADEVTEDDIVREATPPPHTRVLLSPSSNTPTSDDINPWA